MQRKKIVATISYIYRSFFSFLRFFFFLTFHILRKWMIFPKKSLVLDKLKLDMDDAQLVKNNNN